MRIQSDRCTQEMAADHRTLIDPEALDKCSIALVRAAPAPFRPIRSHGHGSLNTFASPEMF